MSKMKDFKKIADEIMCDIKPSEELKGKTVMRCREKRKVSVNRFLVPAAGFLLILGIVNISGLLPFDSQTGKEKNPQINLLKESGEGPGTLPEKSGHSAEPGTGALRQWTPATPEEAKRSFGDSFLTPAYIPAGFKLEQIHASGLQEQTAAKVVLSYFAGEQSFLIIEEKTELQNGFVNFKTIDINGVKGYAKPAGPIDGQRSELIDTEIHWFKNGVHYSVAGLIPENEATKVAKSMK